MKKSKGRLRHIPERTCAACRRREAKRGLIRLVRTPEGQVEVDLTGKRTGRGAYLCPRPACWEEALRRRSLNRALRVVLTPEEVERLRQYARSLPVEGDAETVERPNLPHAESPPSSG